MVTSFKLGQKIITVMFSAILNNVVMLGIARFYYARCHYAECYQVECRGAHFLDSAG
jgi:hypothetical protein